jgi:hypothetical protein
MTYPKTRITRSRSRNMRKKHLVKSKSKRINRSRKSKKNHSRKYRGGDSTVTAADIEQIITDGKAETLKVNNVFAEVSSEYKPSDKINSFLSKRAPGAPPTILGYAYGGGRTHLLYRSKEEKDFLVIVFNTVKYDGSKYVIEPKEILKVYYLKDWMLEQIRNKENREIEREIERERERERKKEIKKERKKERKSIKSNTKTILEKEKAIKEDTE